MARDISKMTINTTTILEARIPIKCSSAVSAGDAVKIQKSEIIDNKAKATSDKSINKNFHIKQILNIGGEQFDRDCQKNDAKNFPDHIYPLFPQKIFNLSRDLRTR